METRADPDPALSIPAFFAGKTLLLTGATGFLAKAVLEKILRDLPEVGKVILLVRGKGGSKSSDDDAWKRADSEIFGSGLFGRLREERGGDFDRFVREKVECLPGDVRFSDLGIGEERFAKLGEEVDIVINCAATVNFDERLDTALETNVFGVANLLEFARTAGASLVQVSTAYVCGSRNGEIEEAIVPLSFDLGDEIERLRGIVEALNSAHPGPETLQRELVRCGMEQANARGWIDTYTYTKSLGEQWLALRRGEVAAVIVRPSIIESTLREPEPGWIEGLRMADPILIAAGQGLTRFPMDLEAVLDLIPLDFVVNAILAASSRADGRVREIPVFTVASGARRPLVQRELIHYVREFHERRAVARGERLPRWSYPPPDRFKRRLALQIRLLSFGRSFSMKLSRFPLARRFSRAVRRRQWSAKRSAIFLERYLAYIRLRCHFTTANTGALWEGLSPGDQEHFGFDATTIDWRRYLQDVHLPGLYRNVVAESVPADREEGQAPEAATSPRFPERSEDRSTLDLGCYPVGEF